MACLDVVPCFFPVIFVHVNIIDVFSVEQAMGAYDAVLALEPTHPDAICKSAYFALQASPLHEQRLLPPPSTAEHRDLFEPLFEPGIEPGIEPGM